MTSWTRWVAAAGLAVALVGCAPVAATKVSPVPGLPPASPMPDARPAPGPGTPVGTTASGGRITSNVGAPALIDSGPSADAVAVLATLPDPIPPEKRVPPPAVSRVQATGGGADVPVPAPTRVMGEAPVLRDSVTMPVEAIDHTCWRVQVAAPPERPRAESTREAAESQLLVKMVIETDRGLHKVRTRDCFTAAGADSLRRRADRSGFTGSFRFKATRP